MVGGCVDSFLSSPRPHWQTTASAILDLCRPLLLLRMVFQLCACHPHTSNMTVAERFATFRYYCLMHVYARVGLTLTFITVSHKGSISVRTGRLLFVLTDYLGTADPCNSRPQCRVRRVGYAQEPYP